MFYIILVIAGIALAANRKQQTSAAAETQATVAQSDTVILPHFMDVVKKFIFIGADPLRTGPGIGAPLSANNPGISNIIVSGPTIYGPGKGGAPAATPAGGGTSAGAAPSASGSGGVGPAPPRSPYIPNTL